MYTGSDFSLGGFTNYSMFDEEIDLPTRAPFKENAIIIDFGSSSVKVRSLKRNYYKQVQPVLLKEKRKQVGTAAIKAARHMKKLDQLITPLENGKFDWDYLPRLLEGIFDKKREAENACFVICESMPVQQDLPEYRDQRIDLALALKKMFHMQAYFVAPQPVFALKSFGQDSGIVIDIGHSQSVVSVVFNGSTLPLCTRRSKIGGKLFDEVLLKEMFKSGASGKDQFSISKVKREICFVSQNPSKDRDNVQSGDEDFLRSLRKEITTETGQEIVIDKERFLIPEILFDPSVMDTGYSETESIVEMIRDAKTTYEKFRRERERDGNDDYTTEAARRLSTRFCIVGGSTAMPGMIERLMTEITLICNQFSPPVESNGRREGLAEIQRRLGIQFNFEQDVSKRGQESVIGACDFAERSSNLEWIYDVQLDERMGTGYDVLFKKCPL